MTVTIDHYELCARRAPYNGEVCEVTRSMQRALCWAAGAVYAVDCSGNRYDTVPVFRGPEAVFLAIGRDGTGYDIVHRARKGGRI